MELGRGVHEEWIANKSLERTRWRAIAEPKHRRGTGLGAEQLKGQQITQNAVVISLVDGKYIWKTRGGVELAKSTSGLYSVYHAANGSGYVKVNETEGTFMEHVHLHLATVTYWGRKAD